MGREVRGRVGCSQCSFTRNPPRFRKIIEALTEKKDKAADTPAKVKKLYMQARARVVGLRAFEVSEIREKINRLLDVVEAKNLELQTMPGGVEDGKNVCSDVVKLRAALAKDKVHVAVMSGLRKILLR